MPTPRTQSGFFIRTSNPPEQFEMVLCTDAGRLRHFSSRGASYLPTDLVLDEEFGAPPRSLVAGTDFQNVSLIQSSVGYLELVASADNHLAHYWRSALGWGNPTVFGAGVADRGNPAFVQSRSGRTGNFEVVVPRRDGGLAHYWRDNDPIPTGPWRHSVDFGSGAITGVAMIFSSFGNLELVATEGQQLVFYWRNQDGWQAPMPIGSQGDIIGQPAFIQSNYGRAGNFEVVGARQGGGLTHFWRDNDDPNYTWHGPFNFGRGEYASVSMIQDSDNELIVCARSATDSNRMDCYRRKAAPSWLWLDPLTGHVSVRSASTAPAPTPPTTPPPHPMERLNFHFTMGGNWRNFITPTMGEIYVTVAPPMSDLMNAPHYELSTKNQVLTWSADVPASAGASGNWTFQMHLSGTDIKTGAPMEIPPSPIASFPWQSASPAGTILLDRNEKGYFVWGEWNVLNG